MLASCAIMVTSGDPLLDDWLQNMGGHLGTKRPAAPAVQFLTLLRTGHLNVFRPRAFTIVINAG